MDRYIAKIDYIKILLLDKKLNDVIYFVNELKQNLDDLCNNLTEDLTDVELTTRELNVKNGNNILINNYYMKLINKTEDELIVELNGKQINLRYIIL